MYAKVSNALRRLWRSQSGTAASAELVLIVTLLAIGLVVGAKSVRDSLVNEFADFAQALANLDQSYNVPDDGTTPGSGFVDAQDFCDTSTDDNGPTTNAGSNDPDLFLTFGVPPNGES